MSKTRFAISVLPFALLSSVLGLSWSSSLNKTELVKNSLLSEEYFNEITQETFINRAKQILENNQKTTNKVTDLDWILNPEIKAQITNQMTISKNGLNYTSMPNSFEENPAVKAEIDKSNLIKHLNEKYIWTKNNSTFSNTYNINDANFTKKIKQDLDSRILRINFNNIQDNKAQVYSINDYKNRNWWSGSWLHQWKNTYHEYFKYFQWDITKNNQNLFTNITFNKTGIENPQTQFQNNSLLLNYQNIYQENSTKIKQYGSIDGLLVDLNERQARNISILLKLGFSAEYILRSFNKDENGMQYFGESKWRNTWAPRRESDLTTKNSGHFTELQRNLIFNAFMLADYIREKDFKSITLSKAQEAFNSEDFDKWRKIILNDISSQYTLDSAYLDNFSKSPNIIEKNNSNKDRMYNIKLNLQKNWPGELFYPKSKNLNNLSQVPSINFSQDKLGDWKVSHNSTFKLYNSLKPQVNLVNQQINFVSIGKVNIAKLLILKSPKNATLDENKLQFGFNLNLLNAFYNQAYLVQFYKQMHKQLVLEREFNFNITLKNLFGGSYARYKRFFNRFIISGLQGKYELQEMKNIEKLFYNIKNNSENLTLQTIEKIENSNNSVLTRIKSYENFLVPPIIISGNKLAQWVETMNEAGFEFKTAKNLVNWNNNNIYVNDALETYLFDDGTQRGSIAPRNDFNFYYNFLMPIMLSQDFYADVKVNQNGSWIKQKIYDGKSKVFSILQAKEPTISLNKIPNSNLELAIRNIYLDNRNGQLGNNYNYNSYQQIGLPIAQVLASSVAFNKNKDPDFNSENLIEKFQLKEYQNTLYWHPQRESHDSLFSLQSSKLKNSNSSSSSQIAYIPIEGQSFSVQKTALEYIEMAQSNRNEWDKFILNLLIYFLGINRSSYENIEDLVVENTTNPIINKEFVKKLIKPEYHYALLEGKNILWTIEKFNATFASDSFEAKLIKFLVENRFDLGTLLPNNNNGIFYAVVKISPSINPKSFTTSKGFYLIDKKYNSRGALESYQYLIRLNANKLEAVLEQNIINEILDVNEKPYVEQQNLADYVDKMSRDSELLFKKIIKYGSLHLEPKFKYYFDKKSKNNYLELLYPLTISSRNSLNNSVSFSLDDLINKEILPIDWILDSNANKLLIPTSTFVNIKQEISLPVVNEEEMSNYLWIGWDADQAKNRSLDDLILQLNVLDIHSKKILFNFEEQNDDLIANIIFQRSGKQLKVIFELEERVVFSAQNNTILIPLLNEYVGLENFEVKSNFTSAISKPKKEKILAFIKQFNNYSLAKKMNYFQTSASNNKNPLNGIESIILDIKEDKLVNSISIYVNVALKENYIWKTGIQNDIIIDINFDDAAQKEVSISQIEKIIQPRIDIAWLQQNIDQNKIRTNEALLVSLNELSLKEKSQLLNWKIESEQRKNIIQQIDFSIEKETLIVNIKIKKKYEWVNKGFEGTLKTAKYKLYSPPVILPSNNEKNSDIKNIKQDNEDDKTRNQSQNISIPLHSAPISKNWSIIISLAGLFTFFITIVSGFFLWKFFRAKNKYKK